MFVCIQIDVKEKKARQPLGTEIEWQCTSFTKETSLGYV
jgi:hypothetical protein